MAYQYQTNILAPRSESIISYNAYKKLNLLNTAFTFYIPVYNNMPEDPAPYPSSDSSTFVKDNTRVYLDDGIKNGTDVFNIRSSASSELDNIIYTLNETKEGASNRVIMTRTKKGNGYDWDYVEFTVNDKTIKGYVWNEYVKEYDYTKVTGVTLDKQKLNLQVGEEYNLQETIAPSNAKFKTVSWTSSNESIVSVVNGKVTALKEGSATITVTTDDEFKTATCEVIVTKKGPEILLDREEYSVVVGKSITPIVTLKNIDDYTLEIKNNTYASVDNKTINGIKEGETYLVVKGSNNTTSKEVKLKVLAKPNESYEIDESLKVLEKTVTNISTKTNVSIIKEKLVLDNLIVKIKNSSGKELNDAENVGTGTTIEFLSNNGTLFDKLTIVVKGDVTGDGVINSADLLRTVKYLKGTSTVEEKAADVTKDGKVNSADLLKIVKYLKGITQIDFS